MSQIGSKVWSGFERVKLPIKPAHGKKFTSFLAPYGLSETPYLIFL